MRWNRQEYIDLMTFNDVGRQMFVELFGPLIGLEEEWIAQGASRDELNLSAFDFDYVSIVDCGGNTGLMGGVTPRVIEETSQYIIEMDAYGRRTKLCKGFATIPLPMDYPVKNMDDWLKIKPEFVFREDRIDWNEVEKAKAAQRTGSIIAAWMQGGFDLPRQLMGEEEVCYCYYDHSYPGCYDISSAGHIPAGDDFILSALRELKEELGIDTTGDKLIYCGQRRIEFKATFHGQEFWDRQVSNIYGLWWDWDAAEYVIQRSEIESVLWMDLDDCMDMVRFSTAPHCIWMEELHMIEAATDHRN